MVSGIRVRDATATRLASQDGGLYAACASNSLPEEFDEALDVTFTSGRCQFDALYYLAGPPHMVEEAYRATVSLGVPKSRSAMRYSVSTENADR